MPSPCKPSSAAAARSTSRKTVKVKGKSKALSVDLHCHIHTDAADAIAQLSATNASPIARYGNPRTEAQQKKLHEDLHKKLINATAFDADLRR